MVALWRALLYDMRAQIGALGFEILPGVGRQGGGGHHKMALDRD